MKKVNLLLFVCVFSIMISLKPKVEQVQAFNNISVKIDNNSIVFIDDVFGAYMTQVDENIFYSLSCVDANTLVNIYGDLNTPIFNKAKECINPCMAMATTWNEAGRSWAGISLTTMMDFNPSTYINEIDWINVSSNLEQVNSMWYISHTRDNYNINVNGYAYRMPVALCQHPSTGSRQTDSLLSLGVGPYQITSKDWDYWDLNKRVNPILGYEASLKKIGTSWTKCGINPISDLTVYALFSLGHQGGELITYDFGKDLINVINRKDVQDCFDKIGKQMYLDLYNKALTKQVSLSDLDTGYYLSLLEQSSGIDFSIYNGSDKLGKTNKGEYVAKHCLSYVFYKYYFTSGR